MNEGIEVNTWLFECICIHSYLYVSYLQIVFDLAKKVRFQRCLLNKLPASFFNHLK